jgi:hypothetical protein
MCGKARGGAKGELTWSKIKKLTQEARALRRRFARFDRSTCKIDRHSVGIFDTWIRGSIADQLAATVLIPQRKSLASPHPVPRQGSHVKKTSAELDRVFVSGFVNDKMTSKKSAFVHDKTTK